MERGRDICDHLGNVKVSLYVNQFHKCNTNFIHFAVK